MWFHRRISVCPPNMHIDKEGLYNNDVLALWMGWQIPRLPGLGDVNWEKFIAALQAVHYDYVVSIEHEDATMKEMRNL